MPISTRRLGSVSLTLLVTLTFASCSNNHSSSTEDATPVIPLTTITPASVSGAIMRDGASTIVVDDPANAPASATPLVGAVIDAYNHVGDFILSATSDPSGAFDLQGLPTGYILLELRTDPLLPESTLVYELTVTPDTNTVPGMTYPVSRDDAIAIALEGVPQEALVLGTLNPLPAGSIVYPRGHREFGEPTESSVTELTADAWFFFINTELFQEYNHPVEYVFVDAQTGDTTRQVQDFRPFVNHGTLWTSPNDALVFTHDPAKFDPADLPLGADFTMTSEVVQSPNITEDSDPEYTAGLVPSPLGDYSAIQSAFGTPPPITRDNFNNPGADGVFVIFIRTGEESHHEQNVARLFNEMEDQGVPKGRTAVADFTKTPPPRIPDTSELPGSETRDIRQEALRTQLDIFMQFFEPAIQSRLDEGKHSTLIVYFTGHAGGGAYIIDFLNDTTGSWTFNPEDLSVTESKACRIRMIFQSCQAERIQEKMATEFESTEHDVILFAASNRSASAYATPGFMSYIPIVGLLNPGGSHFTNEFISEFSIEDGDLAGVTNTNEDGSVELISDLSSLKGNAPAPWVRKSHPSWCFDQFMSITGTVWLDEDLDGWQDAAELGKPTPSVLIELFQTNSGTMTLVDSVSTSGGYAFNELPFPAEYYTIKATPPSDFALTLFDQGSDEIDSDVDDITGLSAHITVTEDIDVGVVPPQNDISECEVTGSFTVSESECGVTSGFNDTLNIIVNGTTMTIEQPSTGDVNTGTLQSNGAFFVESASGNEHYQAVFDTETWTGSGFNSYTDTGGCVTIYAVDFTPVP